MAAAPASCRTRCAGSATWAPLLIPFYIPRGAEWDYVWGEAERLQAAAPSLLPPVATVLIGYGLCAGVAVIATIVVRWRGRAVAAPVAADAPAWSPDRRFRLSNGAYTLEVTADGRSFSRSWRLGDQGPELDLTRRSNDRLQLSGKFFYFREPADAGAATRVVLVARLAAQPPRRQQLWRRAT